MKNNRVAGYRSSNNFLATACVLLLIGAGCNCNTIYIVPSPQVMHTSRPISTSAPPPPGGILTPITASVSGPSGTWSICGQSGMTKKAWAFYPPDVGPAPGETLFVGWLYNETTSRILSNNTYVLQWFVLGGTTGCANPVAGSTTDFSFPVSYPTEYNMRAFFKSASAPPTSHVIKLHGTWTIP